MPTSKRRSLAQQAGEAAADMPRVAARTKEVSPGKVVAKSSGRSPIVKSDRTGLTPLQEAFAQNRALGKGRSDSLRDADPDGTSRMSLRNLYHRASLLDSHPLVRARIQELLDEQARRTETNVERLFSQFRSIAFGDRRGISSVHVSACRHCWGEGNRYQYTDGEFADAKAEHEVKAVELANAGKKVPPFNPKGGPGYSAAVGPNADCPTCGGVGVRRVMLKDSRDYTPEEASLFEAVKQGKDGIELKMPTRAEGLAALAKHLQFYEEQEGDGRGAGPSKDELDAIYESAMAKLAEETGKVHARSMELLAQGLTGRLPAPGDDPQGGEVAGGG